VRSLTKENIMATKLVRLVTGENLLANVTDNGSTLTLKKPAMIVMINKGEVGLVPWIPFAKDESVTIAADKVLYCVDPEDNTANEYSTGFGSGLVMPTNGGVKPASLKLSGE
jgi:hypothetical protein